jgi:anti-sigma-K factor RskA
MQRSEGVFPEGETLQSTVSPVQKPAKSKSLSISTETRPGPDNKDLTR